MENAGQDGVAAFDARFTNRHIQKLKILVSFLDPGMQKILSVFIKYLELRYTAACLAQPSRQTPLGDAPPPDPEQLCSQLLPYCTAEERQKISRLREMLQAFRQYQELMEMLDLMKELFPEGTPVPQEESAGSAGWGFPPETLSAMMGMDPESMAQIMHVWQTLSVPSKEETIDKGGDRHES